ncbi:hypothetical protein VCHE16_1346 [Vibrio paracholerae HE-16]|nr:hypothetical protein VCHE16_1346 [Vibrio paracholerae HE-16]
MIDSTAYFFLCLNCQHEFCKSHRWVLFCPKCRSLKVIKNYKIVK